MVQRPRRATVRVIPAMTEIDAADWDACADATDPFLSHAFLSALEQSGSASVEAGWVPQHLVVDDEAGRAVAAAPLYLKSHSYGEYVFDFAWANAYQRVGRDYYPKLQCCVPFTPVAGQRLLVRADGDAEQLQSVLIAAMAELAGNHGLSSFHISFPSRAQWALAAELGLLQRTSLQYRWRNQGYGTFDDFLSTLVSRKRQAIKKERRHATHDGVCFDVLRGDDIKPRHWDAFYDFYRATTDHKWGQAYLTRDFFHRIGATMADRIALVVAEQDGQLIAGALNLVGHEALFGRYWGCRTDQRRRHLHFEACYYQAIELAIRLGLSRVEAGAQGEHKIQRGYLPETTYSVHWIADPQFREAIAGFLMSERGAIARELAMLSELSPYRVPAKPGYTGASMR